MTAEPSSSGLRPRPGALQQGGLPLASQDSHLETFLQAEANVHPSPSCLMPLQFVPRPVGGTGFSRPRRLASPSRRPHILGIEATPLQAPAPRPRSRPVIFMQDPLQPPRTRRASDYVQYPQSDIPTRIASSGVSGAPGAPSSTTSVLRLGRGLVAPYKARGVPGMITSAETHTRTWELCLRQWSLIRPLLLPISGVLGELESSSNADRLLRNLLSSVSENTLTRYLANIHKFIMVSEELALDLGSLKQFNIADILLSLHRGEVHISNALKALRWAAKAFHLRLPDLYGGLLLGVESRVLSDRKEALPLPIFILAAWERFLLSEEGETGFRLFIGGLLVAANASLRFSDCQHVLWSSLQAGRDCLRAISYRTKSSRRGMPFGLVSCGFYGDPAAYYHSWVCKYLYLLGCEWDLITERFGETVPDALFFLSDDTEWRPMSYAQALSAFRGAPPHEAGNYTLHSLKTSLLASLAQLQVSFKKRGLQGHHRSSANGCVLLYSRDDVHGALSLQQMFWDKVRSGWLPLTPQARGGLHPAKQLPIEPPVLPFQTSPAHSRFPVEDISALPSATQVVSSPPAVPAPEAVEPAGDSDVDSSSSSMSSSAPSTQQARSWTKVSEQEAEEHLWVQTSSGLIHCATPHSGLEGIVVVSARW